MLHYNERNLIISVILINQQYYITILIMIA